MVGKVVSLSHSISPRIPLWPGDPSVVFEDIASLSKDGYFLRRFSMGEHSATHMNAPNSFYADGIGVRLDDLPARADVSPQGGVIEVAAIGLADGVVEVLHIGEHCNFLHRTSS